MPIEITEFERQVIEKKLFSSKKYIERGRKLHFDYQHELELYYDFNVVHKQLIQIGSVTYEQVNSDNLYRLRQGEKTIFLNEKQWLPVKKELNP